MVSRALTDLTLRSVPGTAAQHQSWQLPGAMRGDVVIGLAGSLTHSRVASHGRDWRAGVSLSSSGRGVLRTSGMGDAAGDLPASQLVPCPFARFILCEFPGKPPQQ